MPFCYSDGVWPLYLLVSVKEYFLSACKSQRRIVASVAASSRDGILSRCFSVTVYGMIYIAASSSERMFS